VHFALRAAAAALAQVLLALNRCLHLTGCPVLLRPPPLLQGVDVFAKDFLLVPIHDALHWSLAIICHPALIAQHIQQRQQQQQVPPAEAAGAAALARAGGGAAAAAPAAAAAAAAGSAAAAGGGEAVEAQPVIIHLDSMQGEPPGWARLVAGCTTLSNCCSVQGAGFGSCDDP
jgi:hypothetical protein